MIFKKREPQTANDPTPDAVASAPTLAKVPNMAAAIYENAAADAQALAVLAETVAADMEVAGLSAVNTRQFAARRRELQSKMEALRDAARSGDAA